VFNGPGWGGKEGVDVVKKRGNINFAQEETGGSRGKVVGKFQRRSKAHTYEIVSGSGAGFLGRVFLGGRRQTGGQWTKRI